MKRVVLQVASLTCFLPSAGFAAEPANVPQLKSNLARCVQMKTSGEDRILTAQWVFAALSTSPEMTKYVRADASMRDVSNKKFAGLFGRLATRDCRDEVLAFGKDELQLSFGSLGEALGEIGFAEVMKAPEVEKSLGAFADYFDEKDFAIFKP